MINRLQSGDEVYFSVVIGDVAYKGHGYIRCMNDIFINDEITELKIRNSYFYNTETGNEVNIETGSIVITKTDVIFCKRIINEDVNVLLSI